MTDERDRSYVVRETVAVGSLVALTRDHVEYLDGVEVTFLAGVRCRVLAYTNAGFRGIEARLSTTFRNREFTVSAGALRRTDG